MDVNFIFKIAAVGIIVAVLNTLLVRSGRDDQAMLTTLAGVIVVLMMLILFMLKAKLIPFVILKLLMLNLF